MNNQTCCFTGHRSIPENDKESLQKRLEDEIINLIHQDVRYFGAGGALGFDTMAALTVLKLKGEFPDIRLILVLPCKGQTRSWSDKNKKIYDQILSQADKTVYTSENYYSGCMQKRDRWLIEGSDICICYQTANIGGTAYTVNYARRMGRRIIGLAQGPVSMPATARGL